MRAPIFALSGLIVLMFVSTVAAKKKRGGDDQDASGEIISLVTFGRSGLGVGGANQLSWGDVYDIVLARGDCKLGKSFPVEIDHGAFRASYEQFDRLALDYYQFKAKSDLIDQCLDAVKAMERLCEAGADEAVRVRVKRIRCTLLDRKPKESTKPMQMLGADGTWIVSYTWWSSDDDFVGVEDGLAKSLRVPAPEHDGERSSHLPACRKQSDCKRSGDTCHSSAEHGPRCVAASTLDDADR